MKYASTLSQSWPQALALLFAVLLFSRCGQTPGSEPPMATVGQRAIDWREVWRSFHLEPKWDRNMTYREAYLNQLDFLIDEKLFAQAATAAGMDRHPAVAGYLQAIKEKEMIKALYRRHVENEVQISDEEYLSAYLRSKKRVQFDYILTPDPSRAGRYAQQAAIRSFAEIPLMDPNDEQGRSPLFRFGDMAPELEDVVFEMQPGEIRGPIRVGGDYVVLKLIDGQVDKFLAENDFHEQKSKIHKVIFERRARRISDQFVYDLLKDEAIEINPAAFFPLAEQFAQIVQSKVMDTPFPIYLNDAELNTTRTRLQDMWDMELVRFGSEHLTVRQFLEDLLNMPTGMRPQVNMKPQLKRAIAVAVRNRYLLRQAYAEGLDRDPTVKYETAWQQDRVLAQYWQNQMRRSLQCTPEEIAAFRQKPNFEVTNQQLGGSLDDATIRKIILDYKFAQRRVAQADSLRGVYGVQIDTARFIQKIPEAEKRINYRPMGFAYRDRFE